MPSSIDTPGYYVPSSSLPEAGGEGSRLPHHLVKGVGPGAPPGEEAREADRLEHLGQGVEADGLEGPLLDEDVVEVLGEGSR